MAALSPAQLAQLESPQDPCADWITPEEQLYRLATPLVRGRVYESRMRCTLPDRLTPQIEESAARSMIDYSNLPGLREQSSRQIQSLFNLCTERLIEPQPMPTPPTNWYTACSLLKRLPKKIPPAPGNIHQILENKETPLFFSLISEEFETLNYFEKEILKPYAEIAYSENKNPLRFARFWPAACEEHGDVHFAPTHWVAMTKDVLPTSRSKSWDEQVALVDALSHRTHLNYEIPTLQQSFAAMVTHKVATGESLYQIGSEENHHVYTYTHVKDTTQNYHLIVGGFAPSGVRVLNSYAHGGLGVAALRKF